MSGKSAYYCVIQYCPDRGRAEAANLGVLLYAPSINQVQAKVGELSPRARKFFGLSLKHAEGPNAAAKSLAHLVNSGAASIDSTEALEQFVGTRANEVGLTAPRLTKVTAFAQDLEELFEELVEPAPVESLAYAVPQEPMVPPKLFEVFNRLSGMGRIKTPGEISVPVLGRKLDIPYAYQNGVLNLVKPQVVVPKKKNENETVRLAAEGQLLAKHPDDGERRLIVVAASGSDLDAERRAGQLLNDFGVRFVRQAEADAFAEEVEQQAH